MVQFLADPASPGAHHGGNSYESQGLSREEHALRMKELNKKRGLIRAPRRGWTMMEDANAVQSFQPQQAPIPENAPAPPEQQQPPEVSNTQTLTQRPKLPPPRRSYSVQDYEPMPPNLPKPSSRMTILSLPSELHYTIIDQLDPIDSVCFGLAHPSLWAIHKRKYPRVSLSARYSGPNDMEWAWRGAGPLIRSSTLQDGELAHMRLKGQVYCRKCGISRCELHRHLKDWIGDGWEYCEIKEMFGPPAGEDAKSYCYLSSPKKPDRCGRHGGRKGGTS